MQKLRKFVDQQWLELTTITHEVSSMIAQQICIYLPQSIIGSVIHQSLTEPKTKSSETTSKRRKVQGKLRTITVQLS